MAAGVVPVGVSESFSTIATYRDPDHAEEARRALEAAGIDCLFDGERLRVRNLDALRAGAVLDANCPWIGESELPDEPPPEVPPCACEVCEPMREARAVSFALVAAITIGFGFAFGTGQGAFFALVSAAVYFLIADRWRCAECGASWN